MTFEISYNVPMVTERMTYVAYDDMEAHEIIEEIINVHDGYDVVVRRTE